MEGDDGGRVATGGGVEVVGGVARGVLAYGIPWVGIREVRGRELSGDVQYAWAGVV